MTQEEVCKTKLDLIYLQRDLFEYDLFFECEKKLLLYYLKEIDYLMSKNMNRRYKRSQEKTISKRKVGLID